MPSCQAYGCSNTTGRTKEKYYFRIPDPTKEKTRADNGYTTLAQDKVLNHSISTSDTVDESPLHLGEDIFVFNFTLSELIENMYSRR